MILGDAQKKETRMERANGEVAPRACAPKKGSARARARAERKAGVGRGSGCHVAGKNQMRKKQIRREAPEEGR